MDSAADLPSLGGVAPFGNPRIKACSRLPRAFRSVPRPSSPLGAKASTRCPCFPPPPPATTTDHAPHEVCDFTGAPPGGARHRRTRGGGRRRRIPATTTKGRPCEERPAYPCQMTSRPQDGKTNKRPERRLADARRARRTKDHSLVPATGTSSPPHDVQTAKACHASPQEEDGNAWWAWADLNGRPHAYQACALTS